MENKNSVMFIHALTGLHPGSGTALGAVDLPVQRERHTHWPTIPASSIKGVFRDAYRNNGKKDLWLAAFGNEPGEKEEKEQHAGALAFTDARILAFPVRSLKGVFAWVTCPAVLNRLKRDLNIAGQKNDFKVPEIKNDFEIILPPNTALIVQNSDVLLEEYKFTKGNGSADEIANWLSKYVSNDEGTKERLKTNLALISDNDFTHFVRHATEIVARNALEYETKTTKKGALFYEEVLPPETIMYSLLFANDSRQKTDGNKLDAQTIMNLIADEPKQYMQFGADETIGRGICAIKFLNGKEG